MNSFQLFALRGGGDDFAHAHSHPNEPPGDSFTNIFSSATFNFYNDISYSGKMLTHNMTFHAVEFHIYRSKYILCLDENI